MFYTCKMLNIPLVNLIITKRPAWKYKKAPRCMFKKSCFKGNLVILLCFKKQKSKDLLNNNLSLKGNLVIFFNLNLFEKISTSALFKKIKIKKKEWGQALQKIF